MKRGGARLGLPRMRAPRTVAGRRRLLAVLMVVAALLAGYIVSMLIFPAPLVSRETPVARVIALPAEEAERRLTDQGFRPRVEERETDPTIPAGHVMWQDPPPGVELPPGTLVRLAVSEGPASVVVPDVTEFMAHQAVRIIQAGGLRVGAVDSVAGAQPAGVVLSTRPSVGTSRPSGSAVDLIVSRGPASIRVPNVVGMDRIEARAAIEAAGLRVGTITARTNRRQPSGRVLEQRPGAGTLSPVDARINLIVARPEGP